ncbi:bifunctional phosphoglucose/phosphomannose isomerase [bacterium SCSIO 12741]|nr:bifunctional phosphoglucose/phosphomannose isomerase [bacterium SCSIO 12741]
MDKLVAAFPDQLEEAIQIGEAANLNPATREIKNLVISGLGGSGIGGTIVSQILASDLSVPVVVNKDYNIPAFVGEDTLFIACSYSGNTEETLMALEEAQKAGAEIACITSGGKLLDLARDNNFNHIVIPAGMPPRAAFAYPSVQLFYLIRHYELFTSDQFKADLKSALSLLRSDQEDIRKEARVIAESFYGKIPIIYSEASFEGIGVRLRQQINENSKALCWHHVLPEMNHNELVGWASNYDQVSVLVMRNESDFYRTQERMNFCESIIRPKAGAYRVLNSRGSSIIERAYYLIHTGDWASVYLAEMKAVDPVEVDVITDLKNRLAEI